MKPSTTKDATTEVAAHMSFDIIRYAQVWEDSRILNWALEVNPQDQVLSITSAGCNVLSLLLKEPAGIVAVDLNPMQNAVLALKLYAIQNLDHKAFLEIMGLTNSHMLEEQLKKLPSSRWNDLVKVWATFYEDLGKGLPNLGRLDSFFVNFAQDHFAHMDSINEWRPCFETSNLAEQQRLLPMFENENFKKIFVENFGRSMLEKGRDPAQFRYVTETDIGTEFYYRFLKFLKTQPLYANPYNYFFMFGKPIRNDLGADYIQESEYGRLKNLSERIRIETATIEEVLDDSATKFITKANLSNIFEYMSEENMSALLKALSKKMPKGGRIAFWNLLVDRSLPADVRKEYRLVDIPDAVRDADRVWFYKSFHVLERI